MHFLLILPLISDLERWSFSVAYYATPHRVGALSVDGHRLSVCPVPDHKSGMEGSNKRKIGRKKAHDTVTRGPIYRFKGQGHQAA